jgi:hypothetical protein
MISMQLAMGGYLFEHQRKLCCIRVIFFSKVLVISNVPCYGLLFTISAIVS